MLQVWRGMGWEWNSALRLICLIFRSQLLARAGNRESLIVEQLLDAQNAFNVALAVHALACTALDRLQLREFGLPEAEYIGREPAQVRDFTDTKIQFVGDEDFFGLLSGRAFFPRRHR